MFLNQFHKKIIILFLNYNKKTLVQLGREFGECRFRLGWVIGWERRSVGLGLEPSLDRQSLGLGLYFWQTWCRCIAHDFAYHSPCYWRFLESQSALQSPPQKKKMRQSTENFKKLHRTLIVANFSDSIEIQRTFGTTRLQLSLRCHYDLI